MDQAERAPKEGWPANRAAGILTILLGIGVIFAPIADPATYVRTVGICMIVASAAEGLAAIRSRGTIAWAAALLALSGALAGAIIVAASWASFFKLTRMVIGAVALRGAGAAAVSIFVQPAGKALILCRAGAELSLAAGLFVSVLALLVTIPFASLSSIFFGGRNALAGSLFGVLIATSFIIAGASQLILASGARRRARKPE
jgi:uncharacterized membrane protein HdeD (DUF308 family)